MTDIFPLNNSWLLQTSFMLSTAAILLNVNNRDNPGGNTHERRHVCYNVTAYANYLYKYMINEIEELGH